MDKNFEMINDTVDQFEQTVEALGQIAEINEQMLLVCDKLSEQGKNLSSNSAVIAEKAQKLESVCEKTMQSAETVTNEMKNAGGMVEAKLDLHLQKEQKILSEIQKNIAEANALVVGKTDALQNSVEQRQTEMCQKVEKGNADITSMIAKSASTIVGNQHTISNAINQGNSKTVTAVQELQDSVTTQLGAVMDSVKDVKDLLTGIQEEQSDLRQITEKLEEELASVKFFAGIAAVAATVAAVISVIAMLI